MHLLLIKNVIGGKNICIVVYGKNCVDNMEYFQKMFGAPEIVSQLFFEVFICMTPMILLMMLLCTMQCASCVWSRCAKNTEAEDLEITTCNNVYINTR